MAREPVSPMNTLAGWRFWLRKPTQHPAIATQKAAREGSPPLPRSISCRAMPVKTTAPQPAARPSRPSVRLVALLSAMNTNNPSGQISRPRGRSRPKGSPTSPGSPAPSQLPCQAQTRKRAAARACSTSLPRGLRPVLRRLVRLRQSSMAPIAMKARVTAATASRRGSPALVQPPINSPTGTTSRPPIVGVPALLR